MPYSHLSAQAPIAIFDSGIGGLTIADSIEKYLPNEKLIYVADNKFAPYGEKSVEFIQHRVNEIADYFISENVKAIVIACNTATVNAIDQLRTRINIPVIGVEPAIKPAAKQSINKKVGILVTLATSKNQRFLNLVSQHKNGAEVFIQPCAGLVEAIESCEPEAESTKQLLTSYLLPLKEKHIDTLVLGCTHYPMLEKQIKEIIGKEITLIDTALPVTKQLKNQLEKYQLLNTEKTANNSIVEGQQSTGFNSTHSTSTWLSTLKIPSVLSHQIKSWQLINI